MSNIQLLKEKANEIRKDIVQMVCAAKSGHPGGSLSSADIVATLYFHVITSYSIHYTKLYDTETENKIFK